MADKDNKLKKYGKSKNGNFLVIDTIGVPHPYCITPKHLKENDGMCLTKDSMREAEKRGAVCDICKKINRKSGRPILTIDEHEQALLVACSVDPKEDKGKELQEYLLSIKEMAVKDNFAGFAFLKKF